MSNQSASNLNISDVNQELLGYFIENLESRHEKSTGTINNIKRDLDKMLSTIESSHRGVLSADSIRAYIEDLKANYMETSFVSKLSSIRQFVNWLNLSDNPFWTYKVVLENEDFKYYGHDEIFVYSLREVDESERELNRLVIGFIYEFFLTLQELSDLKLSDYNQAANTLSIRGLELEASASLKADLKQYLKGLRLKYVVGDLGIDDHLIVNERSLKFAVQDLRSRLAKMRLRPVYLRRSRIVHLLESGLTSEEIEAKLGIKISQDYEEFEKEPDYRLLKAYRQFHPRGE